MRWVKSFLKECDALSRLEPRNGKTGGSYNLNCRRGSKVCQGKSPGHLQPREPFCVAHGFLRDPAPRKGPSLKNSNEGVRLVVSPPLSMFTCANVTKISHKIWVKDEKHKKVPQSPTDHSKRRQWREVISSRRRTLALYPGPPTAAHGGSPHPPDGATLHGICRGDTASLRPHHRRN